MKSELRPIRPDDIPRCAELLAGLPEWFGIEASNRESIDGLSRNPAAVAELSGQVLGFISLIRHNPRSVEIGVLAVERSHHRRGVGRALVEWSEQWCRTARVPWLHVKTRGPSTPDPGYERTRAFYLGLGFDPLFESTALWGPEDAALILVKNVA